MLKPDLDTIGLHVVQPSRRNLGRIASRMRVSEDSRVNLMLPAGSNSNFSAELAAQTLAALHAECRDATLRVIARVDLGQTKAAAGIHPKDTAALDALVAAMNADPAVHQDLSIADMPWLQQLEAYCDDLGHRMTVLIQRQSNSRIEAERAVNPPPQERGIIDSPTHVIQLAHVGSLARRQRMGLEDGFSTRGHLPLERRNASVIAPNLVRPPATASRENPLETSSLLAAALENLGVPLAHLRRLVADIKGMLSQ